MERTGQAIAAAQLVEMLTLGSAMKLALPRLPPAAPATLGAGLVVGSNGIMAGSQLVVSAEWVERWNRMIMKALFDSEAKAGRRLKRNEILKLVAAAMKEYKFPMNFTPGRGR